MVNNLNKSPMYYQYMYSYPHKSAYYDIDDKNIIKAIKNLKDDNLTAYIHVPFCETKCGYCNLFSIPNNDGELLDKYVDSVCKHIKQYKKHLTKDIKFSTLVIGGGTPLILSIEQFNKIFTALEENLGMKTDEVEFIIETSPNQTDLSKLKYLKEIGVNRISIGVQSFIDSELKSIYRQHDKKSCHEALEKLKPLNFDVVNIDLIYGIEGQSRESLIYSINNAVKYKPEEIFIYPLYIRENTGIFEKMNLNHKTQHEMYDIAVEELNKRGYVQTSMRRFVRKLPKENISCGFDQMISFGCGGN